MSGSGTKKILVLIGFTVIIILGAVLVRQFMEWEIDDSMDVYYSWVEGQRLLDGENPYSRIHAGDMRENHKYATYFPLFYELSALSQAAGLDDLESWSLFWRIVISILHLEIAALVYFAFARKGQALLGFFSAGFWVLYRWPLNDLQVANFESIPIFFLIASLLLFDERPRLSLVLYSVSLALKQIGIFLLPLYIIWVVKREKKNPFKALAESGALIASVPVFSSMPFLFWDFSGFVKSILFSVTRRASLHLPAPTIDVLFQLDGFAARLPMLVLFALFFILAWKLDLGKFTSALVVMAIFIGFNPVLFLQYFTWMSIFIPLVIYDFLSYNPKVLNANQQGDV